MVRRSPAPVTFYADFSPVAKFIGAGLAMTDLVSDRSPYLDLTIDNAFDVANETFNLEAASVAATGATNIKHMFEWGTSGINRGKSNARPAPTSERARLWKTTIIGVGKSKKVQYVFKPSLATVPKPTNRDTGMSTDVIQSMRTHVFHSKAMVMETGLWVDISPKNAKFLLIPYFEGATGFRPHDKKRGYILSHGPIQAQPGRNVKGNFTQYWTQFWEGRGEEMMNKIVMEQIEADFVPEMMVNSKEVPEPAMMNNIVAEVETERKRVAKKATSKAKARKVT